MGAVEAMLRAFFAGDMFATRVDVVLLFYVQQGAGYKLLVYAAGEELSTSLDVEARFHGVSPRVGATGCRSNDACTDQSQIMAIPGRQYEALPKTLSPDVKTCVARIHRRVNAESM